MMRLTLYLAPVPCYSGDKISTYRFLNNKIYIKSIKSKNLNNKRSNYKIKFLV